MRKIRYSFEKKVQNCTNEAIEKYEQCLTYTKDIPENCIIFALYMPEISRYS